MIQSFMLFLSLSRFSLVISGELSFLVSAPILNLVFTYQWFKGCFINICVFWHICFSV